MSDCFPGKEAELLDLLAYNQTCVCILHMLSLLDLAYYPPSYPKESRKRYVGMDIVTDTVKVKVGKKNGEKI